MKILFKIAILEKKYAYSINFLIYFLFILSLKSKNKIKILFKIAILEMKYAYSINFLIYYLFLFFIWSRKNKIKILFKIAIF